MISFRNDLFQPARLRVWVLRLAVTLLSLWAGPAFAAIALSPATLPNGTQTVAYNQTITANGGSGPYTFAITSGALPDGLSLSSSGAITGTPTTTGVANFIIQATDQLSNTGSRSYSISVGTASLTLLPTSLPAATQGASYSQTITAVGGTSPYTFQVSSGTLPSGLTLTSAGVLSGTPTVNGSFGFIVQATDANGNTGFRTYTLNIGASNSLTLSPSSLPNGSQGSFYNQTVTASGGTAPYTYAITSGSLPNGLSLNTSSGAITGTPTTGGTSNFTIGATDSVGDTGSQAYSLSIGSNSLTLNPASLPNGTQGTSYNHSVSASGGTAPYTYAVTSGSLPAGLSLNASTGAITGTPSGSGQSNFTIQATDANSNFGSRAYTVNIGTNSLTVNPSSLPNGTQGTGYSQSVSASGGTAPYTFAVSSGALPTGLSLNANTGAITGTPTASGVANFTIQATDANANTGSRAYAVTINAAPLTVNPASLPAATQGSFYTQTISASGGAAPYSYAIISGALPSGLSFNTSTGVLSGTPTASGTFNFTVQATDSTPNTGTRAYTLNVGANTLTLNPSSLPNGTQGSFYNQGVTASGGTGSYTYSVSSGALPSGLSLNPNTGAITGTPSASGPASFTIRAVDNSTNNFGTQAYNVNIGSNSLTLNPASLPSGTHGVAYNQSVSATGGTGPYTYAVVGGALPAGLSLNASTGAITGTPTGSGASGFTIQATDSVGDTGNKAYSVNIGTTTLTVNPASLPAGTNGSAYNQTLTATGGSGPYTFAITSGALPAGLTLNTATGAITGTPTGSGQANFTVQASDGNGDTGTRAYALWIGTNNLIVNPASLPAAVQGTPYNQTVVASGGTAPYIYSIVAGGLPPGLSFNPATGQITGTPTGVGTFSITIQAVDVHGDTGGRAYAAFQVRPNPATDPDVDGVLSAQAAIARRFVTTQVTNVTGHMEDLHGAFDPCLVNLGIGVSVYDQVRGAVAPPTANNNPMMPAGNLPSTCAGKTATQLPLALWASGTVQFGSQDINSSNNRFSTDGLTIGADGRFSNALIVGVAVGIGTDHTSIGTDGTSVDAHNIDAMLYASYQPFDGWFLDAVVGYGTLGFNSQRYSSFDNAYVSGTRSGSEWFGSLTASTDFKTGAMKISPYVRADLMSATLQGYSEQGPSGAALTYGDVSFNSVAAVVGLRGTYDIPTSWGVLSPNARLEFRHELDGGFNQFMYYSDLGPGQPYVYNDIDMAQNLVTGAVGVRARSGQHLSAELEYRTSAGDNSTLIQAVRAALRVSF